MNPNKNLSLPTIALIGSPNVGKSSLFNRLIGKRKAIVESFPGITRNRLSADITLHNMKVKITDTGGIKTHSREKIDQLVYGQVKDTLKEADIIFFVCDGRAGATPVDYHITSLLRKSSKKIFLLINKIDTKELEGLMYDFYQLGIGQPYPVSAGTKYGLDMLLNDVKSSLSSAKGKRPAKDPQRKEQINVAIVGRQNVGKSSFINTLFDQEVVIVDAKGGTTRDSVDVHFEYADKLFVLIDTAGMKHKRKLRQTVDIFSLARTKASIRKTETALVMLDAVDGLCRDDIKVLEYVIESGKPCGVVVNKWDLVKDVKQQDYEKALRRRLNMLEWMPVIFISCYEKRNILQVLDLAASLKNRANINIKTSELNKLLKQLQKAQPHPLVNRKKVNILYATQIQIAPPVFALFSSYPKLIKSQYLIFLENNIRSHFGLFGVPIRFKLRER